MTQYDDLHARFAKISDLGHAVSMIMWDEAAMMPVGGGEARGRAMSTLQVLIHEMMVDADVQRLAEGAATEKLDDWQSANVREIRRWLDVQTALPAELVEKTSLATSRCEQAWRIHRAANDWPAMKPMLGEVVDLMRQRANILAEVRGCSAYDALLDEYEPGMTSAELDRVFGDLKTFLPEFIDQVVEKQAREELLPIKGDFSIENQKKLGIEVMSALGFDFEHGRLDVSHHPFCGGVPEDVRITTRYYEDSFIQSLMGVIHETGHALYEQGRPADWRDQPVGEARSAGTHESQSLIMEMQACRTPEFFRFLAPMAQRAFLGQESNDPAWSADNLFRVYTRVEKSFIRVDADEATYPLHVILRYEIERDLIEGNIEVDDLPDVWHAKMTEYLGISTEGNFQDGCLQDVHWPAGLFGYFPTYTLGAMTAAQLFAAASEAIEDLKPGISRGNFSPLLGWLRENIHGKGSLLSYDDLMIEATGSKLDARYFKDHLTSRYL